MLRWMHPLLGKVPRLQELAVFEAAARLGSFTRAAAEIGSTQPAVSRRISSLERSIGATLFHRSANRVALTAHGESLLAATRDGFDLIESGLHAIAAPRSTFLVAANPGFAQAWLVPYLDQLQDALGDWDLRLRLFDRDSELRDQEYDVAIHLTSIDGVSSGTVPLFFEEVVPVASPKFATAHDLDHQSNPESLLHFTKLYLDGRDRTWMDWSGWFDSQGLSWSPDAVRLSYNNYPSIMNDAIASRGIALAWRGLVEPLIDSGTLVIVGPSTLNAGHAYQLIPGPSGHEDLLDRLAGWLGEMVSSSPGPSRLKRGDRG